MATVEDQTSNGPATKMYRLKPYYDTEGPIDLPTCMYNLSNVYEKKGEFWTKQPDQGVQVDDASTIGELEKRQERIFSQIEKLQREVDKLLLTQNLTPSYPVSTVSQNVCSYKPPSAVPAKAVLKPASAPLTSTGKICDLIQDLVISANPSRRPLSIFVLQQILSKQYSVLTSCYVHSSVKSSSTPNMTDFLDSSSALPINRNDYKIGFTIIWKDEYYSPTLKVSPSQNTQIIGEGNITRYLARLLLPSYDSSDFVASTQIDELIDIASAQFASDSEQTRAAFIKTISTRLGKSPWMLGNEFTLADIVLWSAVRQYKQASKAPDNISRWLESCGKRPEFTVANRLM